MNNNRLEEKRNGGKKKELLYYIKNQAIRDLSLRVSSIFALGSEFVPAIVNPQENAIRENALKATNICEFY